MSNLAKHLYIHVPFCKYICTYCDFIRKIPKNDIEINKYINKIIKQINELKTVFKTIYIGGGTPNFLSSKTLKKLLNSLQKNINMVSNEIKVAEK